LHKGFEEPRIPRHFNTPLFQQPIDLSEHIFRQPDNNDTHGSCPIGGGRWCGKVPTLMHPGSRLRLVDLFTWLWFLTHCSPPSQATLSDSPLGEPPLTPPAARVQPAHTPHALGGSRGSDPEVPAQTCP